MPDFTHKQRKLIEALKSADLERERAIGCAQSDYEIDVLRAFGDYNVPEACDSFDDEVAVNNAKHSPWRQPKGN